jgi:hypothetical protein
MRHAIVAAAGAIAVFVVAAAAAAIPLTALAVSPSHVHRGHLVTVSGNAGSGCPAGDTVTILSRAFAHTHMFAGVPAVFALVHAGGKFKVTPRIPSTRHVGSYGVSARCGGGNLGVSATIHVIS